MGPPRKSKRQRKQKGKHSLKSKQTCTPVGLEDALQETYESFAGGAFDSNATILAEKEPEALEETAAEQPAQKQLSKSQQRKLRRLQEEKERKAQRLQVLRDLSQHQLKSEELQLLQPMASRGQKETKRQALKRALQLERAGIQVPANARLLQERPVRQGSESSDGDSSGSDDDTKAGAHLGSGQHRPKSGMPGALEKASTALEGEAEVSGRDKDNSSSGRGEGGSRQDGVCRPASGRPVKKQRVGTAASPTAAGASAAQPTITAQRAEQGGLERRLQQAGMVATIKAELGVRPPGGEAEEGVPAGGVRGVEGMGEPGGKPRVVMVQRRPEIEEVREGLPITGQEQEVMEAVLENDVVVLCGETGCGKTTQVPQFLYEAGFGCRDFPERAGAVGVTQPRRVAAISTAQRVADELNTKLGQVVGYQVRYDKRVGEGTAIKFMTDGILLRELQSDFLLRRYSAIVVDEAHERSLNTDILLGMLSRIVRLRRQLSSARPAEEEAVHPLKLIIMSATLRTEDFVGNRRLFPSPPPVVSVPARQYPVTVHFSKKTELHDYVGAAYKKVCQIHRTLPPGGVLVFLTGQREVEHLCTKLRAAFAPPKTRRGGDGAAAAVGQGGQEGEEVEGQNGGWGGAEDAFSFDAAEAAAGAADAELEEMLLEDRAGAGDVHDDFDAQSSGDEEEVVVMGGQGFSPEQIAEAEKDFEQRLGINLSSLAQTPPSGGADEGERYAGPVHVLPLYAMLPPAQQGRVFRAAPPGARLIVVATNVAETSLTIPGIRYVVDAGRSKQRLLESAAGLARYEVRWVSKASAEQRAGRAGRTGPGHCYRLYSSAHFNDTFPQHSPPEIVNTALEGVVLAMKALGVDKVVNFPFPSPPEAEALQAAERCLVALSALDGATGELTQLGRAMAAFPISPRHARMLLEAAATDASKAGAAASAAPPDAGAGKKKRKKAGPVGDAPAAGVVLRYALALAAALSVDSPFVHVDSIQAEEAAGDAPPDERQAEEARTRAKAARKAALQAHAQFRVTDSDALSALRALCAFEAAGQDPAFCRSNSLHFRNLKEAAALRKQLALTMAQQAQRAGQHPELAALLGGVLCALAAPQRSEQHPGTKAVDGEGKGHLQELLPLTPLSMQSLRKALAAGWADQVSRRVRALEYIRAQAGAGEGAGKAGSAKLRAVRYRSCALDEEVYLHPRSALHASPPEFVVYTDLVRTAKRPYMAGLTAIEPSWLPEVAAPLCTFSPPLQDPPPAWRPSQDQVVCWRDVTFGRHDWRLPPCPRPHPDPTDRCAVFGAALLEGKVLPAMQGLRKALALPPSMLLRPDTRAHRKVGDLVEALRRGGVDSRASLARRWQQDPAFLQEELVAWMHKAQALLAAWGQLQRECTQGGGR